LVVVREVMCQTLLHPLDYGGHAELTANFYKGCSHGCVYCYVPSLIHDERKWGSYVDVKVNAPAVLARELRNLEPQTVFLSSATDPYQALEARYWITRRCLELLAERRFPVVILTRSPLVLRDLDILKRLAWVRVGCSISTVSSRFYEPGVPPLERRMLTLQRLVGAGIETWVSMAPVVPGFDQAEMEELAGRLEKIGVGHVAAGLLRFAGYAESRRMFEAKTLLDAGELLRDGRDSMDRLRKILHDHGLDRESPMNWEPEDPKSIQLTIDASTRGSAQQPKTLQP